MRWWIGLLLAVLCSFPLLALPGRAQGAADDLIVDDDAGDLNGAGDLKFEMFVSAVETGSTEQRQTGIWAARNQTQSLRVVDKLAEIVQQQAPELAVTAAVSLGEIHRKEAVPTLIKALDNPAVVVQEAAAYALGMLGDPAAVAPLTAHQPKDAGLSRWIYQDALDRLAGKPGEGAPRKPTLHDAGLYYLGGGRGDNLRDQWRTLIADEHLRVDGTPSGDINPVMGRFGGPPDTTAFYKLLQDQDGKPQVDAVMLSGVLPFEFPIDLQWRLYQFVRRGGILITLGNSMFFTGDIKNANGTPHSKFAPADSFWYASLPHVLDETFRPPVAGFKGPLRRMLRSGECDFGHGKVISLAVAAPGKVKIPQLFSLPCEDPWSYGKRFGWFSVSQYANILRYAFAGDAPFPVLLDLADGPAHVTGAGPAVFSARVLSTAHEDGTLRMTLLAGERTIVEEEQPVKLEGQTRTVFTPTFALPLSLPDGTFTARLTFTTAHGASTDVWPLEITSPLQVQWDCRDAYRQAGVPLTGSAVVNSALAAPLPGVALQLDVTDRDGRTLQRYTRTLDVQPGANAAIPLALTALDLPLGDYGLSLALVKDGTVLQQQNRQLHHTGPYTFTQDLVYAPWGEFKPADARLVQAFKDAGLNSGSMTTSPGWYDWQVCTPGFTASPEWPGDWVAHMIGFGPYYATAGEFGKLVHERLGGATTIHHWDETEVQIVSSVRGDIAPVSSVLYRNWLKSRYLSLDALNDTWRKEYKIYHPAGLSVDEAARERALWANPSTKIPPPRDWNGDLTSWNQIWLYRGAKQDWEYYADSLWTDLIYQSRNEVHKYDREHPWIWYDTFHTRLYPSTRPDELAYQEHESQAALGNAPGSIMLHYMLHIPTLPGIARMVHYAALAGGGRHFIIYTVATGTEADKDPSALWKPGYTLNPHGQELVDSIAAIRPNEKVFLDARNVLSSEVAFLYYGTPGWPPGSGTPRALFDALAYAGIVPESLKPGVLRSERMPLERFKVIVRCVNGDLPASWQTRLAAWQKNGGVLLDAHDFPYAYQKMKPSVKVDQFTFTSEGGERVGSPGFTAYQQKVLAVLRARGVTPPLQAVDDNGLPEPALYPVWTRTEDGSQSYIVAVSDWDHWTSQAFGSAEAHATPGQVALPAAGGPFTVTGAARRFRLWAEIKLDGSFSARVTVDDKGGVPFPLENDAPNTVLWAERGAGGTRWVAGPAYDLAPGAHTLTIAAPTGGTITRVLLTDDGLICPTLKVALPGVKAVYDVYHDRQLTRAGDGWALPMGLSACTVLGLVTEELGDVQVEPRLLQHDTDRVLQVQVRVRRRDGTPSDCRHAVNITVTDAAGKEIAGLQRKGAVRGWQVFQLFPAVEDPPLPWTVEVRDLTSGLRATARVTGAAPEAFPALTPVPPLDFTTEPLPPLEGDLHLLPFRVTVRNHGAAPLTGTARIELPAEVLLDTQREQAVSVPAGGAVTLTWPAVLGRKQAIALQDTPPRVWLTLHDGRTLERQFDDVWIRTWETAPPLVTNLHATEITMQLCNFLDKPVSATLTTTLPEAWQMSRVAPAALTLPAAEHGKPGVVAFSATAVLKAGADQSPTVHRLPLRFAVGAQHFDGGDKLVESEKRRTWHYVAGDQVLDEVGKRYEPDIPAEAVDAKKNRLWDVDWQEFESDTLIDFPLATYPACYAVTNVRFPHAGTVTLRLRGDSKVQVWLAGIAVDPRKPIPVPANTWQALVVNYQLVGKDPPSTDLVFLDEAGKVRWDADFSAVPAP